MAKNNNVKKPKMKKKKGIKKLTDERPQYDYREPFRPREVEPALLKHVEDLDWHPRRCYIAYDWDASAVCIIFPEPIAANMWRYFEFNMNNSVGAHLLWGSEIEMILKKAKKAGRRRRVL